ncbi:FKBP-type peptidyl-prolyl cis-trans isomerase [Sphingomonas natans]|nr:FKBP-type peptidyl-prolyl cis-trans isomerase [Sphingomonas sp. BIUV-7]
MNISSCKPGRLAFAIIPLLWATPAAIAATARPAKPRSVAPKPIVTSNAIIALPLNPIIAPAQRLCGARTASGLGYDMLRPASGAKPAADATVLVNYIGYLAATGVVFDQGMRSPLPVSGVIPGFSQGLQMMSRTGIVRLCIPAAIGYGAQASGPIPANSDLVFQVELVDFKTAAEMADMQKSVPSDLATQPNAAPQP